MLGFFLSVKKPPRCGKEEKSRYPQELEDNTSITIKLRHFASVEEPAEKCQADAAENNSRGEGGENYGCVIRNIEITTDWTSISEYSCERT